MERCGLLKERSILINFCGKHRCFDFDFLAPKIWTVYTPNKKVLTVAYSPVHTCDYSRRFQRLFGLVTLLIDRESLRRRVSKTHILPITCQVI